MIDTDLKRKLEQIELKVKELESGLTALIADLEPKVNRILEKLEKLEKKETSHQKRFNEEFGKVKM